MDLHDLERETLELFRPPKRQTVSEWADENRVLVSESSSEPGRGGRTERPISGKSWTRLRRGAFMRSW